MSGLAPCIQEEVDTRILLHLEDDLKYGYNKVSIRTVDTDVVVLAVTSAQRLNITEDCLWCWKEHLLFTGPRDGQRTGS